MWLTRDRPPPAAPATQAEPPSIAVLPFADMSSEKNQEYFSDGLAEELLNSLAKIPGLRVAARTSSFQFKGKTEDLRTVADKLNVSTILEGSVRTQGGRVRITAQLIKASDGFHLWSDTYDRELRDIFAVQDEIARAVAGSLQVALLGDGKAASSAKGTSVEAYNAVLQGRYFYDRRTKESSGKGVGLLRTSHQAGSELRPRMGWPCNRPLFADGQRLSLDSRRAQQGSGGGGTRTGAGSEPG